MLTVTIVALLVFVLIPDPAPAPLLESKPLASGPMTFENIHLNPSIK